jgi:hypothetical protein
MARVIVRALERQRGQDLADALHPGPAAVEAERDVGAEGFGDGKRVAAGPAHDRGGVGRSAAQAAARGDALGQQDAGPPGRPP